MENKNQQENTSNHPQWGEHNPKLTDENFIDRGHKKIDDQNELLAPSDTSIDLSTEEPGRNRKGAKEGTSKL